MPNTSHCRSYFQETGTPYLCVFYLHQRGNLKISNLLWAISSTRLSLHHFFCRPCSVSLSLLTTLFWYLLWHSQPTSCTETGTLTSCTKRGLPHCICTYCYKSTIYRLYLQLPLKWSMGTIRTISIDVYYFTLCFQTWSPKFYSPFFRFRCLNSWQFYSFVNRGPGSVSIFKHSLRWPHLSTKEIVKLDTCVVRPDCLFVYVLTDAHVCTVSASVGRHIVPT